MGENVEINGYRFYAEDWDIEESQDGHEVNRIKIMNGTEAVTLGAYTPTEVSFTTHKLILNEYDKYNKMISELNDNIVEVLMPEIGDKFNAHCYIKKKPMNKWLELKIKLVKVEDSSRYALTNRMYDEPFISIYRARDFYSNESSGSLSVSDENYAKPNNKSNNKSKSDIEFLNDLKLFKNKPHSAGENKPKSKLNFNIDKHSSKPPIPNDLKNVPDIDKRVA